MTSVGFLILFGLNCLLFPCKGGITSPPVGTKYVLLPGKTAKIKWEFDDAISTLTLRFWSFTSSDGSTENLASIFQNGSSNIRTRLFEVDIERPATLVLKNVNQSYNGVYRFALTASGSLQSDVPVSIAKKPSVTCSCPSRNEVNEGDNFTCVCRGKGGNPPASVTWNKDGKQIGATKKENNTLTLSNVNETHTGNYTCEARSHTNDEFADEKSIQLQVYSKPKTKITFEPESAVVGSPCIITCDSSGFPAPNHTITHNGAEVSTKKTYTIKVVEWSDAGIYKCVAKNVLGNDSASANLTVTEPTTTTTNPPPTSLPSTTPLSTSSSTTSPPTSNTTSPKPTEPPCCPSWAIVLMVIAAVVVLVIIAWLIHYCKKKEKDGYRGNADVSPGASGGLAENQYELDGEPSGGVDNTYDTVNNPGASGSKSKPPEKTTPDVYAAVDKKNREGKPLYATLDSLALEQADNSKKKRDEERAGQTEYASIDFAKIGKADQE